MYMRLHYKLGELTEHNFSSLLFPFKLFHVIQKLTLIKQLWAGLSDRFSMKKKKAWKEDKVFRTTVKTMFGASAFIHKRKGKKSHYHALCKAYKYGP